ncbi:testis-expressed protein 264 [Tetranychus urticae]|uniref:Uncharacterized protein n=1 Tax=Tetranychus urticae TaxID=32264 RepID=T1K7W9_TETUR|nr:testis-expressed protein 264 [Tetranychus urticae]
MLIELSIIFLSIALAVTIFLALCYFGLFETISVKTGESPYDFGGKKFIYKVYNANSASIGSNFTRLTTLLYPFKDATLVPVLITQPIGSKSTKSLLGVLFEHNNDKVEKMLLSIDYKIMTLPKVNHVVSATFTNKGSISVAIALKRVYPVITEYIKENKLCAYPSIEIYKGDVIYFLSPLSKQQDFFMNEVSSESSSDDGDSDGEQVCDDQYSRDPEDSDDDNEVPSTASSVASSSSFEQLIADDVSTTTKNVLLQFHATNQYILV